MSKYDPGREEIESLVTELVSIETENPPGNEKPGSEFVYEWFNQRDIDAELVTDPFEDRPQVVASVGEGSPTVVLNGHIDIFPAGDQNRWSYDPYDGTIEDDQLYGRGSIDMKTGVALGMLTTARAKTQLERDELDGQVIMHLAVGEESGEPGTQRLVEQGWTGDYGVVLEPTSMVPYTSTKGLAWYEITVTGEPSHAGYPDQGKNAINHAIPVILALRDYDKRVREREHPLCGPEYASLTRLDAGTKENVIPESTTITIDRRFSPDRSVEAVDDEVEEVLSEVASEYNLDVTWKRTRLYESAETDPENDTATIFRKHSHEVADVPFDPAGAEWSCDFRNLVNEGNMTNSIVWGPGDVSQAGTIDEHVDLNAAIQGLNVLTDAVDDLLDQSA